MVAQPYIARWLRVLIHVDHENSHMLIPLNFQGPVLAPTGPQLHVFLQNLWTAIGANVCATMANTYVVTNIDCTDRSAPGRAYDNYVPPTNTVGTAAGDALPANVADCLSWKTGLSGRTNRGRTFFMGMPDTFANGSTIVSVYTAAVVSAASSILTFTNPGGITVALAVASIKDLALKLITGYVLDSIVDSQRRRLPGRGA